MGLFKKKKRVGNPENELPELPKLPDVPSDIFEDQEPKKPVQSLPSFPSNSLGNKFSQNSIKEAVSGGERGEDFPEDESNPFENPKKDLDRDHREKPPVESKPEVPKKEPVSEPKTKPPVESKPEVPKEEPVSEPKTKPLEKAPKKESEEPKQKIRRVEGVPSKPRTQEIHSEEEYKVKTPSQEPPPTKIKKQGSVFVKIDKFEESLETFDEVRKQLDNAEKFLNKIKEIKEEETKELESWGDTLESMKSQIERVDKDIFSKIE